MEPKPDVVSHDGFFISIGIIAWNEERAIPSLLQSVFQQTLFQELARRGLRCEVFCVANGCTDRTVEVATELFREQERNPEQAALFSGKAINLSQRGKINAWNEFVHSLSAREARYLILMDADIVIHNPRTLWNLVQALESDPEARVSVDVPRKDLEFKPEKTFREQMSLRMSRLTRSASAQLCGQLYCIRSETARNIFLPRDLTACDDGFIKSLVCTDFLSHGVWPSRIQLARDASHTFEAYTSLKSVFKNQKRQAIGQTIVHLLIDDYLKRMPAWERARLAETLRRKEHDNPDWLKKLIHEHLRRKRFFWRLYPGLISHRFLKLKSLSWSGRIKALPAVLLGTALSLIASFAAFRFLKSGSTNYWPRAERSSLQSIDLSASVGSMTRFKIH
jgi:Glycosyltransferases involved in cell wall biogenesis